MALAELVRLLEDDTAAEVRSIAAAGAAEAARIEAEADHARRDRIASAVAAFAADRRAARDAELAAAVRTARADVLLARAAMLERVREAVRGELPGLVAASPALGRALVAAALDCAGDEAGTLRCAPVLAEAARAAAPPTLGLEVDPEVATGAIVDLAAGLAAGPAAGTRIDATLAALLDRAWPALACQALQLERAR